MKYLNKVTLGMINGWHVYLILILGLLFHRQMVWVRQIVFLP